MFKNDFQTELILIGSKSNFSATLLLTLYKYIKYHCSNFYRCHYTYILHNNSQLKNSLLPLKAHLDKEKFTNWFINLYFCIGEVYNKCKLSSEVMYKLMHESTMQNLNISETYINWQHLYSTTSVVAINMTLFTKLIV